MEYSLKELINYDYFNKIYDKAKAIYNTNRIKYNCYLTINNEYIDTYIVELPYTDSCNVYTQLRELYLYNDVDIYVKINYY